MCGKNIITAGSTLEGSNEDRVVNFDLELSVEKACGAFIVSWPEVPGFIGYSRKSLGDAREDFADFLFDYHDTKMGRHGKNIPAVSRIEELVKSLFIEPEG
ncbi:hypothetical protein ACFL0K_00510 [Patescibacteria group bacterium]